MSFDFYYVALLFFIYSFLGWCVEVAFVAITARRVENRGFLNGPVCPIYGCGMLGVLAALTPYRDNFILLFIGGFIICTAVELFGGWVLDKIFHMRWWDYTKNKFNIGGYVCLRFSIMWGLGVVAVMKLVHPPIFALVRRLPKIAGIIIISILVTIFAIDMVVTLKNLIGIRKSLGQLDKVAEDLNNLGNQIKDVVGNSAINMADRDEESLEKLDERTEESREKWANASEAAKEKFAEAVEPAREKLAEAVEPAKEKLAGAGNATRDIISNAGNATKEIITNAGGATKDIISNAGGATKEIITNAGSATKDMIYSAGNAAKDKLTAGAASKNKNQNSAMKEKWAIQRAELEAKMDSYIAKINIYNKHSLNSLPKLNKSGKSINIKEYIEMLKNKKDE
ncbi:putative ABC transporter permease [Eubacterium ventriosum]|uniref:putative ABC transporter permease n=1 Tax=Eubacterium ventriosum TaxID=39496 RepID=UPI0032C1393D